MTQPTSAQERLLTLPTLITLAGVVLVLIGVWQSIAGNKWLGLALIIVGRLCDNLDGYLARSMNQMTEFGAKLDATADKGGIFILGLYLVAYGATYTATVVLVLIAIALQMYIATMTLVARYFRHINLEVNKPGKHAMFALSGGFVFFLLSSAFASGFAAELVVRIGWMTTVFAIFLSVLAITEYWKEIRSAQPHAAQ